MLYCLTPLFNFSNIFVFRFQVLPEVFLEFRTLVEVTRLVFHPRRVFFQMT